MQRTLAFMLSRETLQKILDRKTPQMCYPISHTGAFLQQQYSHLVIHVDECCGGFDAWQNLIDHESHIVSRTPSKIRSSDFQAPLCSPASYNQTDFDNSVGKNPITMSDCPRVIRASAIIPPNIARRILHVGMVMSYTLLD